MIKNAIIIGAYCNDDSLSGISLVHNALEGSKVQPDIVSVKVFVFSLKFVSFLQRNFVNLYQIQFAIAVGHNTPTVGVGPVRVDHFHAHFDLVAIQVVQNIQVDGGTQVVDVRNEHIFLPEPSISRC